MSEVRTKPLVMVSAVMLLLVALLLGGQALAGATAPAGSATSTGRVLAQTSYAYLGGLRTFAAAVLWNRLEVLFHGYYGDRTVDKLTEFLPTMRLVQALDPQFEQSYYNSSFILARRGMMDQALAIAREGLKNNPQSGLMMSNLTQLLILQDKKKNLAEMHVLADRGIRPDTKWTTLDDQFEGYGVFRAVYILSGEKNLAEQLSRAQQDLGKQGAGLGVERDTAPSGSGN